MRLRYAAGQRELVRAGKGSFPLVSSWMFFDIMWIVIKL